MLYLIVVWIVLTIVCFLLGNTVLHLFMDDDVLPNINDRFILAIWLGITSLIILFLSLSFIIPLSFTTGIIVSLIVTIIGLFFLSSQQKQQLSREYFDRKCLGVYLLTITSIAALVTKPIIWFDTGLYHWHSIKWLANFGTVTGVSLLASKHGFNSGWFAFSAPLHPQSLNPHVGALSNGFIFLVAVIHFLLTIKSLLQKNNRIADWFIAIYYVFLLPTYTITIFTGSPILISYSPDIPVNFFIGITTWTILLILNLPQTPTKSVLNPVFIPLFLALGTVTIKLTAIPLLLTFLLPVFKLSSKFKTLIISSLFSLILLLPMFAYSIKTTGCLLYPSSAVCFNVPWKIPSQIIQRENNTITGIQKQNPQQNYFLLMLNKRLKWLMRSIKLQIMIILFVTSIVLSIAIVRNKKYRQIEGWLWLISLAMAGMLFILLQIPLLRFGIGYFVTIICLFTGILIHNNYENTLLKNSFFLFDSEQKNSILLTIFLSIVLVANFNWQYLLIPPKLPPVTLIPTKINDVEYAYPDGWTSRCWDAPLPCSPTRVRKNIQLRNPQAGISQGFINKQ